MTALTRRELPREVKKKGKHTHKLERHCVVPAWVYFVGSFYFILTAKAKQTEITTTKMWCLNWEERSVVPLFCLFVLKTSLAAESTCLSEYKRCLRGNISEVLCWWLTDKHRGWNCNSVQWGRGRRRWRKKKTNRGTWVMCKRRREKGVSKLREWEDKKKLIYIL